MKKTITISIDTDLYELLKDKNINVSGTLNHYLYEMLKPKKADFVAEDLTLQIVSFGKNLGLTPEMSVFTHDNLNKDAAAFWRTFREDYKPAFNLFDYMEIRKKFNERFFQHEDVLKPLQQKQADSIIAKEDPAHDHVLTEAKL